MKSLSSIGIALSVIFGCLLLAFVAEVYYLLWWKKRLGSTEIEDNYSNPAKKILYTFCWNFPTSLSHRALDSENVCNTSMRVADNIFLKPFGEDGTEIELLGLQHLAGPPRFLFTIAEETKEDLESEDGKSRADNKSAKGSISLSDFLLAEETPNVTPFTSPTFFTPLTPVTSTTSCSPHRFNPLFESLTDAEFNRIRSSPSPKFKFLQDAEEKLRRKLREESSRNKNICQEIKHVKEDEDCSFITIKQVNHGNSSTSQVPLASSPFVS